MKVSHRWPMLAAALCGVLSGAEARAATLRANPRNVADVLAKAGPGDTVTLEAGHYADLNFSRKSFAPPLTIDARAATGANWKLRQVTGLTIRGGRFELPPPSVVPPGKADSRQSLRLDRMENLKIVEAQFVGPARNEPGSDPIYGEGYGVFIVGGLNVQISDNKFQGFKSGIVLTRVDRFRLSNNEFRLMRSDGIQVAESHMGAIEQNRCLETHIRDKEHPDCIQMWSRPTSPPTADIVIRKNTVVGLTQGVGLFNHVRDGVDDGGFDRITIEDNDINGGLPQGIGLMSGRDSVVRNNRVATLPGSKYLTNIIIGPGVLRCGNVVAAGAGRPSQKDPPCATAEQGPPRPTASDK
jgi:hypothetical protein